MLESDVENVICYTGGVYDELTGLYYLNARYYNSNNAGFLSQDTYIKGYSKLDMAIYEWQHGGKKAITPARQYPTSDRLVRYVQQCFRAPR